MRKRFLPVFTAALIFLSAVAPAALAQENDATGVLSGVGTEASPYVISGWEGLVYAAGNPSMHYRLAGDVTVPKSMALPPIGTAQRPFYGSFDGAGHTVTFEQVSLLGGFDALFGVNYGSIKSLGVRVAAFNDATITQPETAAYSAGIAAINHGVIEHCTFDGTAAARMDQQFGSVFAGGIAGLNAGTIEYCYSTGDATVLEASHNGAVHIGGIAGRNAAQGIIRNCYVTGTVSAYAGGVNAQLAAGGISGSNDGKISACYYAGASVSAHAASAGAQAYAGGITAMGLGGAGISGCAFAGESDLYAVQARGDVAHAALIAPQTFLGLLEGNISLADSAAAANSVPITPQSDAAGRDGALKTARDITAYSTFFASQAAGGLGFQSPWIMSEGGLPKLRGTGVTVELSPQNGTPGTLVVLNITLQYALDLMPTAGPPTGVMRVTYGTASVNYALLDGRLTATIILQAGLSSVEIVYMGDEHYAGARTVAQTGGTGGGDTGTGGDDVNPPVTGTSYGDVGEGHWAYPQISALTNLGVVSGETGADGALFFPERLITRAEFAKIVAGALELPTDAPVAALADYFEIPEWARPYVNALFKAGYMNGREDEGRRWFDPNSNITRAEVMVVMQNVLDISEMGLLIYSDTASIPRWALEPVAAMVGIGLVDGFDDGTIRPNANCTRAQACKMVYGMLQYWWNETALG